MEKGTKKLYVVEHVFGISSGYRVLRWGKEFDNGLIWFDAIRQSFEVV
jgi:hypothetical protein